MKKSPAYLSLLLSIPTFCLLPASCTKDTPSLIDPQEITIDLPQKGKFIFDNSECGIDGPNQNQSNYQTASGHQLATTYQNRSSTDSLLAAIDFDPILIHDRRTSRFSSDMVESILSRERNRTQHRDFHLIVEIRVCGARYHNRLSDGKAETPPYWSNEDFEYKILDYINLYPSKCINRDLLYVKFWLNGNLYKYENFTEKVDTITINNTTAEVFFDIDR